MTKVINALSTITYKKAFNSRYQCSYEKLICLMFYNKNISEHRFTVISLKATFCNSVWDSNTEAEFLIFSGAQESIPRNQFRQPV
jgi:hypothetical protein